MSGTIAPAVWSVDQVAAYLSMSKQWVYKQAELGKLPCYRLGASLRFKPEEVRAYLESTRHGPRLRAAPPPPSP